jgi:hypothetical protein
MTRTLFLLAALLAASPAAAQCYGDCNPYGSAYYYGYRGQAYSPWAYQPYWYGEPRQRWHGKHWRHWHDDDDDDDD